MLFVVFRLLAVACLLCAWCLLLSLRVCFVVHVADGVHLLLDVVVCCWLPPVVAYCVLLVAFCCLFDIRCSLFVVVVVVAAAAVAAVLAAVHIDDDGDIDAGVGMLTSMFVRWSC